MNDPPFGSWELVVIKYPRSSAYYHQPRRFVPQEVAAQLDNPPFGLAGHRVEIIAAWERVDAQGQRSRYAPIEAAEVVNNPPFGQRATLAKQIDAWKQEQHLPQTAPKLPQEAAAAAVNDPPFGLRTGVLAGIVRSYQDILVPLWGTGPQVESVDDPPFGIPDPSMYVILRMWEPPPPEPWHGWRYYPQEFVALPDDPPFGQRQPLTEQTEGWQPGPPLPTLPKHVVQPFVAPVDNPPFGTRPWLPSQIEQWKREVHQPQTGRHVTEGAPPPAVNEPPYGLKPWLVTVLEAWEPGQPLPTLPFHGEPTTGPDTSVAAAIAGGRWKRLSKRRRQQLLREDEEILAVIKVLAARLRH